MRNYGLKSDGTLGYINDGLFNDCKVQKETLPQPLEYNQYDFPLLTHAASSPQIVKVDWLRASIKGLDSTHYCPDQLEDILLYDDVHGVPNTDLVIRPTSKNILGYPVVKQIFFYANNQLTVVGSICYNDDVSSSNCGCLFDATGTLCTYLQEQCPTTWFRLVEYLASLSFRLTRVDLALDIDGAYARSSRLTVPRFLMLGKNADYFSSSHSRNGQSMTYATMGDWSDLAVGDITIDDYDAAKHAPKGLTATFGARSSPNFFRVYEKGKQLLGMADEPDTSIDRHWVRVEQEIKRDKDGSPIPYECLLEPDAWFAIGRPCLRKLLSDYAVFLGRHATISAVRNTFSKKERNLSVKRKIFWAKRAYGRLIRTMLDTGIDKDDVVSYLCREQGLKNFIYDIAE